MRYLQTVQDKTMRKYGEFIIKYFKIPLTVLLGLSIAFHSVILSAAVHKNYDNNEIKSSIEGIIEWKKSSIKSSGSDDILFSSEFLKSAGTTDFDWYAIALGRTGIEDDYFSGISVLKNKIKNNFFESGKRKRGIKATDFQRTVLALLSLGGNPCDEDIKLIDKGLCDFSMQELGRQGVNGYIWELIALDSMNYKIPESSELTRKAIITEILKYQRSDGAFGLKKGEFDVDITAMALQALSPYQSFEDKYIVLSADNRKLNITVRQSVDKAVSILSENQMSDGSFGSYDISTCESTAQVITALCALKINPLSDSRFIKNGNTALDGIMQYRMNDGGFSHKSEKNSSSDSKSGEQAMTALCALYRLENGMRFIYDISKTENKNNTSFLDESIYNTESGNGFVMNIFSKKSGEIHIIFSKSDFEEYNSIPDTPTTENYEAVVRLYEKIRNAENKNDYPESLEAELKIKKDTIENIQNEIDSINAAVADNIYQKDELTPDDAQIIDDILKRTEKLSDYDRKQILNIDSLLIYREELTYQRRSKIIYAVTVAAVILLAVYLIFRHFKRKRLD